MKKFEKYSCQKFSEETYCDFGNAIEERRWYQHDIDQIVYSTYFRKLQRKYQLISEKDPRCRSRMVHTLEVSRIAKEISEKLGLNVELTEGIALAHDIGNTAFGAVSNNILEEKTDGRFQHEDAGYLMLKCICQKEINNKEIENKVVNATKEDRSKVAVIDIDEFYPHRFETYRIGTKKYYTCICGEILDGVRKHGTKYDAYTLEGQVVSFADNISYISQDIGDLISIGLLNDEKLDEFVALRNCELWLDKKIYSWAEINKGSEVDLRHVFSQSSSERIGTLIKRYLDYNQTRTLKKKIHSPFLGEKIPILKMDKGLKIVIDYLWEYTQGFYQENLIKNFNLEVMCRITLLWNILSDPMFQEMNEGYKEFYKRYENPIFKSYFAEKGWEEDSLEKWKRAYFISALSCDEIETIIDMYQQRDYTFQLDL
ncbi:MAG: HD domain-containing protein [Lachnospiraceae bacterium]|nr:HD domain-containing protein [Lachnospiraceae bacterium]